MRNHNKHYIDLLIPIKVDSMYYVNTLVANFKRNNYCHRKDINIVFIDDNSSIGGINKIAKKNGITYLKTRGVGKMAALNLGINATKNKYIAFTDQDNIVLFDNWLEKLLSNFTHQNIGYVSGKVRLYKAKTEIQKRWEEKGALNKGKKRIETNKNLFAKFMLKGVPITNFTVGSNHIIPRIVFKKIGLHDERFGPGSKIEGAAGDLDITYRILKAGYQIVYDPIAEMGHDHPHTCEELKQKMFEYGVSDTAIHLKFLCEFHDMRSLLQIPYRIGQNIMRLMKSLIGKYPLPPNIAYKSVLGNFAGLFKYIKLSRN